MQFKANRTVRSFWRHERGSIGIIFAAGLTGMMFSVGMAIDYGRALHVKAKLAHAIDAAALAGAKALKEQGLSTGEVTLLVQKFIDGNMQDVADATVSNVAVNVDTSTNSVAVDVTASMQTAFLRAVGLPTMQIANATTAIFDLKDIELGLSLDVTGSMCSPCTKIDALKSATKDLIEVMLPDGPHTNKVRIGMAPFAAGINAGAYAGVVSANLSANGCVYERIDAGQHTDDSPNWNRMSVNGDPGVKPSKLAPCPTASPVLALSSDKAELIRAAEDLTTGGSTAGHLGTAWAWYLVSPKWAGVWPTSSAPVAYGDKKTIKAVVLMTDGLYNTIGGQNSWANVAKSQATARSLCSNIKGEGVVVYTVGFQLTDPDAKAVMGDCASSAGKAYLAENTEQLRAVFRQIAEQLTKLRLAK